MFREQFKFKLKDKCPKKVSTFINSRLQATTSHSFRLKNGLSQRQIFNFLPKFLLWCEVWDVTSFQLGINSGRIPRVINQMAHIKFSRLISLNLSGENIINIESLSFMSMPHLSYLNLSKNFITSLKPISKCSFPEMKEIEIYNLLIPLQELNNFSRFKTRKEMNFMAMTVRGNVCHFDSFLAKLMALELSELFIDSQKEIEGSQQDECEVLRINKFTDILMDGLSGVIQWPSKKVNPWDEVQDDVIQPPPRRHSRRLAKNEDSSEEEYEQQDEQEEEDELDDDESQMK